ncbi:BREX-1 system adenine-specific DNA-methyltransferase PglX [Alteromonas halophila]|uniref:site-specific DNA-methyltransferase (adenine-specific) n=1 Tax=Alteromonas halophila TaxID=516698 RepID=A0A918JFR4_9ALTE|nr:BREX-1 system adenine-specific DNA-methyltransferase PglX [Alteromonas halophila]GGW75542.1 type II deoxyribonuclease [Alteromonas halophila]
MMELKKIKKYASEARISFKSAISQRLNQIDKSQSLIAKITDIGEEQVIEQAAYTWFNRLGVIRYLELNEKLSHGYRVLSHPTLAESFQITAVLHELCEDFSIDKPDVIALQLDGDKEEALFRLALLGQCRQLSQSFPFLFAESEGWVDELLPNDLTRSQSIIRFFVDNLEEDYWTSLDVFSELFSAYYADIKKELPKKIGLTELAKATQVTEPAWLSQYMVENALARRWKELCPESRVTDGLGYYLAEPTQPEHVSSHIAKVSKGTQADPQDIKVLDAACGSGRNLLLAYDLLSRIYLEKGYRNRDIPQAIFDNNLFGLDIDERAVQVASLLLVLRAGVEDKRFLTRGYKPTILNLGKLGGLGAIASTKEVERSDYDPEQKRVLIKALTQKYDVVATYPPNLGIIGAADSLAQLKDVAKTDYPETKSNLATMFFSRTLNLLKPDGFAALILKDSWLFLGRYEKMRNLLFNQHAVATLVHMGRGVIPDLHQMNAVVIRNSHLPDFEARYCFVENTDIEDNIIVDDTDGEKEVSVLPRPRYFPPKNDRYVTNSLAKMSVVPTKPLSYWVSSGVQQAFKKGQPFKLSVATLPMGKNIDRDKYVRYWWELDASNVGTGGSWRPIVSGGEYRRWYGNLNSYVNSANNDIAGLGQVVPAVSNSWTALSPKFNAREVPTGCISDPSGPCFAMESSGSDTSKQNRLFQLGLMNSTVFDQLVKTVYPEGVLGSIRAGDLAVLPIESSQKEAIAGITATLVDYAKNDWHSVETSTGFTTQVLLAEQSVSCSDSIAHDFTALKASHCQFTSEVASFESMLNEHVNASYSLDEGEISPVAISDLSFYSNPYVAQGIQSSSAITPEDKKKVFDTYQSNQIEGLISFFVGCLMGRFSCLTTGLVYAGTANENFKETYTSDYYGDFLPDDDGIVPLATESWLFNDDATARFSDFVKGIWGKDTLQENLTFVADSLCLHAIKPKAGEISTDTIRRYFSSQFFTNHCKTYKQRPVYWLISSGKEKAFECLVYLHRYSEGTLSRMRTEYFIPLMSKYESQHDSLSEQIVEATGTEQRRIEKEIKTIEKKQAELRKFDEELKHYAEMRISLDLDDGVKANYGKFGNLLANVKAIHGKAVK